MAPAFAPFLLSFDEYFFYLLKYTNVLSKLIVCISSNENWFVEFASPKDVPCLTPKKSC